MADSFAVVYHALVHNAMWPLHQSRTSCCDPIVGFGVSWIVHCTGKYPHRTACQQSLTILYAVSEKENQFAEPRDYATCSSRTTVICAGFSKLLQKQVAICMVQ